MSAQRVFFIMVAAVVFLGIGLTGFSTVHWFSYVPPSALLFGGVTGICPGMTLLKKLGLK